MKKTLGLFVGSVVLNAVLLGVYVARRADTVSATGEILPAGSATSATTHLTAAAGRDATEGRSTVPGAKMAAPALWATLDSPDLPTLIARLRAAGFPANIVRQIVSARIDALFAVRMREIAGTQLNQPYWKTERQGVGLNSQYYEAMNQLYRDRAKMLREALTDPFFSDAPLGAAELERRRQLGSLPKDKADAVQRIADDYAEMTSKINAATGGIILPEDKEQLALLEREKRADLATVLSPQELEEYEMRTSPVTSRLRAALTLMDATEEEFRAIYAVQQSYKDVLYPSGPVSFERRTEALRPAAEQLKAALGEQRYADYERANSREFQQLNQIAQRENVSREATVQAYTLRDSTARESNRIYDDKTLSVEQKRAAFQALAQNAKAQMRSLLGPAAGEAYLRAANWVNAIENGRAVSFGLDGSTHMRGLPTTRSTRP